MSISFIHDYGRCAIDRNNHSGVNLVSDGKTLAMRWDEYSLILGGFTITAMSVEQIPRGSTVMNGSRSHAVKLEEPEERVHIQLSSVGPVKFGPAFALDTLFLNANDLSVEELLKLAYQKIDARAETEEKFANAEEVSL